MACWYRGGSLAHVRRRRATVGVRSRVAGQVPANAGERAMGFLLPESRPVAAVTEVNRRSAATR